MNRGGWRWLVIVCGVVTACGATPPVSPSPNAGDGAFTGTWVPTIAVDSCTGSHECIALDSSWFVLRLVQDGVRVHGSGYLAGKAFDVSASVDSSEQLAIATSASASFSLDELLLRVSPASGLIGAIRYTSGPMTVRGHIGSAKRGRPESTQTNVQGTWIGNSVVRACTFSGWTECPLLSRISNSP